jgi:hypothetical protein
VGKAWNAGEVPAARILAVKIWPKALAIRRAVYWNGRSENNLHCLSNGRLVPLWTLVIVSLINNQSNLGTA